MKRIPMLLQLTIIVLMSAAASYAFQYTETAYQINGLCFYRYLAYAITVFLGYICFSCYKKSIGLAFSLALSAVAFSPIGQNAIELFPSVVPFLAVFMGVTTVLVVPNSRGRGFLEFLVALALPAILAVSRIGGSSRLLATTQSIGYYELSAVTVIIIGGYFCLRYGALANLNSLELLSNGGNKNDAAEASKSCNVITILIITGASGIAALLMAIVPIVAGAIEVAVVAPPIYVLAFALGAGIAIIAIFYVFQLFHKENVHVFHTK